ncbi:MAG TPA: hypothetical protein DEF89_25735 [Desulfosporosinus sp.]|nr:hypothetical protein [Desulfosporosinus sp.]
MISVLELEQSNVFQHLAVLRHENLIESRKQGLQNKRVICTEGIDDSLAFLFMVCLFLLKGIIPTKALLKHRKPYLCLISLKNWA